LFETGPLEAIGKQTRLILVSYQKKVKNPFKEGKNEEDVFMAVDCLCMSGYSIQL
jgi:hypothetical protein